MIWRISANRMELLQIADAVARDKSIDKSVVLHAMEEAMQRAAKAHYGSENEIKVEIDPKTGETHVSRYLNVVELVENNKTEISLEDARARNPAAQVGDIIAETLPPVDFNRINAQNAKQVIVQKVRDAERERQYEEYKDRIGEIIHGIVKRVGVRFRRGRSGQGRRRRAPRRDDPARKLPHRRPHPRLYLRRAPRDARARRFSSPAATRNSWCACSPRKCRKSMTASSRSAPWRAIRARRAKIAVISKDSSIDPVGACVGMRGVRVQAVVQELQGERIDIIPWSGEAATFIVNALAPAEVSKVVLDEDTHRVEVVVPDEQLSLAIGRRGQNVRLASQLTGWQIDILTEAEESERRQKEFAERTQLFMESLDVDETVAQLLASEGFADRSKTWPMCRSTNWPRIEGFRRGDRAGTAKPRGRISSKRATGTGRQAPCAGRRRRGAGSRRRDAGDAVALGEGGIKTLEDLAGCATDDLLGYYEVTKDKERVRVSGALEGFDLTPDDANAIIMTARVKVGWIEAPLEEASAEGEEAGGEETAEDGEG